MAIYFITKNSGKIKAAKGVFDAYGIELRTIEKDYPEIQADLSLEIARHTALKAAQEFNVPVIREDHSLFIHALGFPGPYTNYIERHVSVEKLLYLLRDEKDRAGHFEIAAVYAAPDGASKEFVYHVPIHIKKEVIVPDPRGGWNGVLCLEGEARAFSEYPEKERLPVWNQNYTAIARFLTRE